MKLKDLDPIKQLKIKKILLKENFISFSIADEDEVLFEDDITIIKNSEGCLKIKGNNVYDVKYKS